MRQTTFVLLLMFMSFCLGWHFAPGPEERRPVPVVQTPAQTPQKQANTRPKPRPKPTDDAPRADLE